MRDRIAELERLIENIEAREQSAIAEIKDACGIANVEAVGAAGSELGSLVRHLIAQRDALRARCEALREALTDLLAYPDIRKYVGSLIADKAEAALAAQEPK